MRLSPTYGMRTRTTFHVFVVRFVNHDLSFGGGLRWVSEGELHAGRTADGLEVSVPQPVVDGLRDRALDALPLACE
jgi:hypothetical protein